MKFLTESQRERIRKCYSGMDATTFVENKISIQNKYMNRLNEVLAEIIKESPELFLGETVHLAYTTYSRG